MRGVRGVGVGQVRSTRGRTLGESAGESEARGWCSLEGPTLQSRATSKTVWRRGPSPQTQRPGQPSWSASGNQPRARYQCRSTFSDSDAQPDCRRYPAHRAEQTRTRERSRWLAKKAEADQVNTDRGSTLRDRPPGDHDAPATSASSFPPPTLRRLLHSKKAVSKLEWMIDMDIDHH